MNNKNRVWVHAVLQFNDFGLYLSFPVVVVIISIMFTCKIEGRCFNVDSIRGNYTYRCLTLQNSLSVPVSDTISKFTIEMWRMKSEIWSLSGAWFFLSIEVHSTHLSRDLRAWCVITPVFHYRTQSAKSFCTNAVLYCMTSPCVIVYRQDRQITWSCCECTSVLCRNVDGDRYCKLHLSVDKIHIYAFTVCPVIYWLIMSIVIQRGEDWQHETKVVSEHKTTSFVKTLLVVLQE